MWGCILLSEFALTASLIRITSCVEPPCGKFVKHKAAAPYIHDSFVKEIVIWQIC